MEGSAESSEGEPKERRISERHIKIVVVAMVLAIVVGVLLWGMVPEKIYEVEDILDNPDKVNNREINVKGVVMGWQDGSMNFTLGDSLDENITISATHTRSLPEGFGNNITVVVKGVFSAGDMHIETSSIQIGCPSKY